MATLPSTAARRKYNNLVLLVRNVKWCIHVRNVVVSENVKHIPTIWFGI
jgi:hypothetical protein